MTANRYKYGIILSNTFDRQKPFLVIIAAQIHHVCYSEGTTWLQQYLSLVMRKTAFCICETKMQISCAVTAQLISAFVFAIQIVQSLYLLNPKFQASSYLLWLYSLVCVGPGRKPRRPVFSQRGSFIIIICLF